MIGKTILATAREAASIAADDTTYDETLKLLVQSPLSAGRPLLREGLRMDRTGRGAVGEMLHRSPRVDEAGQPSAGGLRR